MDDRIDIVILWVDGNDPAWRAEFNEWRARSLTGGAEKPADVSDASEERYRDWDNLKYIFRGIEKFMPWAGRVHLVTWGHLPQWLDAAHPQLNIVNHRDFIPAEYLPTFSSCPIELNIHRIEGLSERFIYFNDDMFVCRPVPEERYFKDGLPRDMARLSVLRTERIDHLALECVRVINKRHGKAKTIRRNPGKWLNWRYSAGDLFKTLTLLPWNFFPGFKEHHTPQPHLRSNFEKLWSEEYDELDATCRHRFRTPLDLIHWLMHYEQLAAGNFKPHGYKDVRQMVVSKENIGNVSAAIRSGRYTAVCLHDDGDRENFEELKAEVNEALDAILGEKSCFEK